MYQESVEEFDELRSKFGVLHVINDVSEYRLKNVQTKYAVYKDHLEDLLEKTMIEHAKVVEDIHGELTKAYADFPINTQCKSAYQRAEELHMTDGEIENKIESSVAEMKDTGAQLPDLLRVISCDHAKSMTQRVIESAQTWARYCSAFNDIILWKNVLLRHKNQ
jgi:hypothetical protein